MPKTTKKVSSRAKSSIKRSPISKTTKLTKKAKPVKVARPTKLTKKITKKPAIKLNKSKVSKRSNKQLTIKHKILVLSGITCLVVAFIIFLFIPFLSNDLALNKTNQDQVLGVTVSGAPVNKAFSDGNFYACIIDALNESRGALRLKLRYKSNVSDKRLKELTWLYCKDRGIKNVVGINKLVNVTSLDLSNNSITTLPLFSNSKLQNLNAENNLLTSVVLPKASYLQRIELGNNRLTSLDLSNLSGEKKLSSFSVAKNNLSRLDLTEFKLGNLDVSGNPNLVVYYSDKGWGKPNSNGLIKNQINSDVETWGIKDFINVDDRNRMSTPSTTPAPAKNTGEITYAKWIEKDGNTAKIKFMNKINAQDFYRLRCYNSRGVQTTDLVLVNTFNSKDTYRYSTNRYLAKDLTCFVTGVQRGADGKELLSNSMKVTW